MDLPILFAANSNLGEGVDAEAYVHDVVEPMQQRIHPVIKTSQMKVGAMPFNAGDFAKAILWLMMRP